MERGLIKSALPTLTVIVRVASGMKEHPGIDAVIVY
jgi:hypothetical protein